MKRLLTPKVLGSVLLVLAIMVGSRILISVPLPGIQLPAESVNLGFASLPNTFLATLVADLIVLLVAFAATRNMKLVPTGLQNVMEWLIEGWYNLSEDIAGKNAAKFFPWVMTFFLFLLASNWLELIPGVDSIGWLESHANVSAHAPNSPGGAEVEDEEVLEHFRVQPLIPGVLSTLVNDPYTPTAAEYEAAHGGESHSEGEAGTEDEAEHAETSEAAHGGVPTNAAGEPVAVLVPFLRAAATDLNLTIGLALIAVVMTQIFGVQSLGGSYFTKFFNFKAGPMGAFVGVMELISEFSKILSFAFRLFGNIFGGQVLLFVMAFLVPWLLPLPFYGLELFVGAIQAFVFGMLCLIFFSGATVSHDDHH